MADSLILKGVKDVRKHTGTEMVLEIPKRGGNIHQLKRWWQKGVSTVYVGCTVFDVTANGGSLKLAIATGNSESPQVRIDHDGSGGFTFSQISELERAAVFNANFELIEHYIFPAIAGGSIIKVIPPNGATGPSPDTTITRVDVVGVAVAEGGDSEAYRADVVGSDPGPYEYAWTVTNGTITSAANQKTSTVEWGSAGLGTITCEVSSESETFDGNAVSGSREVTVSESFAQRVANAEVKVVVTVDEVEGANKYFINGVQQDTITADSASDETIHFDLSDASLSGHPLKIYTDSGKTTEVTVGVEQEGTDLLFKSPIAGSFSYQCASHANMGGDITFTG